jgi:spermidine synthase
MTRPPSRATATGPTAPVPAVVGACFFLSGFAALLYQVAWLRQFSFVFGTSELAVVSVLAAYLAGLAGGAALAARYLARVSRPLWTYGVLEAGIALAALFVPLLLAGVGIAYVSLLGGQSAPPSAASWGQPLFYVIVAMAVLAIPTALMGATLPLLTRSLVRTDAQIGPTVSRLYGINTLGAVGGALAAGFVLLPAVGLGWTVAAGALINVVIFLIVLRLSRSQSPDEPEPAGEHEAAIGKVSAEATSFYRSCIRPWLPGAGARAPRAAVFREQPAWALPIMLLSGANAFAYEVLWTRMLTHVMGGSIYSFATMLAAFLGGIAIGGGFSARFARDRQTAATAFLVAQLAVGILSILIYTLLGPMLPETRSAAGLAGYAVTVMLPATIFLGATFPLAVRTLAADPQRAGADTAQVYAWNTAGAIPGAIIAGFVLIPALGFEGTIRLAATLNFAMALWIAVCVARRRGISIGVAAAALLLAIFVYAPSRPEAVISRTGFELPYNREPEEIFYAVGRSATVLMLEENGVFYLRSNGLPEASILPKGAPPTQDPEKWLTALPVTARPDTQSMLVIGFGGGVALEGVPPSVEDIDVIELEPAIIDANRAIAAQRNRDPLADPRINVVVNDARNALRLTEKRYDAIVSQPSHPWTGGAAHLYTREFLAQAKAHLNDGGILVQWINSEFVDAPLLRSLAATLLSEFANVRLYQPESQVLMFLASDAELDPELSLSRSGRPLTDDIMHYSRMGINGVEDLLAALAMDQAGIEAFAAGARISTDDNLLLATRSRSQADGLLAPELEQLIAEYDPLRDRGGWVYSRLADRADFVYIARRLLQLGQAARALAIAEAQPDPSTRQVMVGLLYANRGQQAEATAAIRDALMRRPENSQARYLLVEPSIGALAQGTASADVTALAAGLPQSAAAVIQGWRAVTTQQWEALSNLDGALGLAGVTDGWYPDAVRLRAEWRSKVTQNVESFAFDALRLIDRAILIEPSLNLFLLRAATGIALKDAGTAIESSRHILRLIRDELERARVRDGRITQRELALIRQNVNAVTASLRGDLIVGNERRAEAIRQNANQILRYIDSVTASESTSESEAPPEQPPE